MIGIEKALAEEAAAAEQATENTKAEAQRKLRQTAIGSLIHGL